MVDSKIVRILKDRYIDCNYYEGEDAPVKCASIAAVSEEAATNWFIKCMYSNTVVSLIKRIFLHKKTLTYKAIKNLSLRKILLVQQHLYWPVL